MLLLISCVVILFFVTKYLEISARLIISFLGGLIASVILSGFINIFMLLTLDNRQPPTLLKYNLVALKDNSSMRGSTFLGTGSFEGNLYYYVMVELDEGFIMKKFSAKDAIVIENSSKNPQVIVEYWPEDFFNPYVFLYEIKGKTKIIVPDRTITRSFDIDLQ